MLSGGPTQTAMSLTRAAGNMPIRTVGHPGGRIGWRGNIPPLYGGLHINPPNECADPQQNRYFLILAVAVAVTAMLSHCMRIVPDNGDNLSCTYNSYYL